MSWTPSEGPPFPGLAEPAEALRARLLERRVVVVTGPLDRAAATRAAMEVMALDASGDEPVHLQIDSARGELDAATALMDVIDLAGVPVEVTAIGAVGGPAVGVVALGSPRRAGPHTRFHLHEPEASFEGRARDVESFAEHRAAQWRVFCERVAAAVGRRPAVVATDFAAGRFLGAAEAQAYGLVDEVCRPEARLYRLASGRPMGFGPAR